jgi:hypothetical protein
MGLGNIGGYNIGSGSIGDNGVFNFGLGNIGSLWVREQREQ